MVQRGQFLERPTLIPVGPHVLEAMSHRGASRPPLLMIPPPPAEGSGMDNTLFSELAWAASQRGFATLRFNHRGVGGSQGEPGKGRALTDDAEAALQLLLENTGAAAAVVASLGGGAETALSLQARHPAVGGLLLINPSGIDGEALLRRSLPLLVVLPEFGAHLSRAALAAAAVEAGGQLEVVTGADAAFLKSLPQVGQLCSHFLTESGGSR